MKILNNASIKKKLLLSYIILVFVPLLVVGFILTIRMRSMALDQAIHEATISAERIETNISNILRVAADFSTDLLVDRHLRSILTSRHTTLLDVVEAYWHYTRFDDFRRLHDSIDNVMLYAIDNTILENWRFMRASPEIVDTPWFANALERRGAIAWNYIYNPTKSQYFLSLTRKLGHSGEPMGVLVISISPTHLISIIESEPFDTFIVDDSDYIILASDPMWVGRKVDTLDLEGSVVIDRHFYPQGSMTKLRIYCVFPVSDIMSEANRVSMLGFSTIGLSFSVILLFIIQFSNQLSNRLIIKQNEIKLKMLASQINPHFLYNTLETIRMKIHATDPETADIVVLLGKIMRRNLEIGAEMTTLGEELSIVRSYLNIQKFRYGGKTNFSINCGGSEEYSIIPMTIQPIVENAVIHGLENQSGEGMIEICAKEEGGYFKITISDNGGGMDPARFMEIKKSLCDSTNFTNSTKRIGLRNVNERIKLHYGDKYGLEINSKLNQGTRVDILLPLGLKVDYVV